MSLFLPPLCGRGLCGVFLRPSAVVEIYSVRGRFCNVNSSHFDVNVPTFLCSWATHTRAFKLFVGSRPHAFQGCCKVRSGSLTTHPHPISAEVGVQIGESQKLWGKLSNKRSQKLYVGKR